MPELVCSAQSCVYNNAMYCSRGDIDVPMLQLQKNSD